MLSNFIYNRAIAFALLALAFANIVLVCTVFYLLAPKIEFKRNTTEASKIVATIIQKAPSVDAAVYWDVQLAKNAISHSSVAVKNSKEAEVLERVFDKIETLHLSEAIGGHEFHAMIEGRTWCLPRPVNTETTIDFTREFFDKYPKSWTCFIPIKSDYSALSGYVELIWKQKPVDIEVERDLTTAKTIIFD